MVDMTERMRKREAFHAALSVMIPDIRGTSEGIIQRELTRDALLRNALNGTYDSRRYPPYAIRHGHLGVGVEEYLALHLMIFG